MRKELASRLTGPCGEPGSPVGPGILIRRRQVWRGLPAPQGCSSPELRRQRGSRRREHDGKDVAGYRVNIYQSQVGVLPPVPQFSPHLGDAASIMGQTPSERPKDGWRLAEGHTAAAPSLLTSAFLGTLPLPRPPSPTPVGGSQRVWVEQKEREQTHPANAAD